MFLRRMLPLAVFLAISCSNPSASPDKPVTSPIVALAQGVDVGLCTIADVGPDVLDAWRMLSTGTPSTADKVVTGIMTGAGALAKGLACYMHSQATAKAQATGEIATAAVPVGIEQMTARSAVCDPASQSYSVNRCAGPSLASFLLLKQVRANRVIIPGKVAGCPSGSCDGGMAAIVPPDLITPKTAP